MDVQSTGTAELGQWSRVGEFEVLIQPIRKPRHVRVQIRPKTLRESKVKHRRLKRRQPFLTDDGETLP